MTPSFDEMVAAMHSCEQSIGFSVYQHGVSVLEYFFDLIKNEPVKIWKLPSWFEKYKKDLINNLHPLDMIEKYILYHDCGKFYCRVIDEDRKIHFPNHAEVSAKIWRQVGGDPKVGNLILNDMVFHTATAEEISCKFNEWSIQDSCTLLLAALAEIHSNASIFGGQESSSFKIKWKQLDRRGKLLCKTVFFGG